jgi:transcriptional regulator with XRE-family HTH domain
LPYCRARLEAEWKPANYPIEIKHLGDHIRRRRLDLGLLQKDLAEQIGVHEQTIQHWETGETAPALRRLPAVIRFLGFDPRPHEEGIGDRLRHYRESRGLSQTDVAKVLGLSESVVWRWEAGQRKPQGKYLEKVYGFVGDDPRPGPVTVGERLKRRREHLGLTLRAGAKRLGVVQSTLCRWESGEREPQGARLERVEGFLRECGAD